MRAWWEILQDHVRCCLNCGSLFPKSFLLLCPCCWELVNHDRSSGVSSRTHIFDRSSSLSVYSLWDWTPGRNDALSAFLVALKGQGLSFTWQKLAKIFVQQRQTLSTNWPENPILIPAPPSPGIKMPWGPRKDHAYQFAFHLAQYLAVEFAPCLEKIEAKAGDQGHQRQRNRQQRQNLHIRRFKHEKFTKLDLCERNIVFVDDVVTTGATAMASILALGPSSSIEIWCLAQREASCCGE